MKKEFRSSCLIASTLDLIGDKWSLLVVRDMLLHQKKTFTEFAASDEGAATNLLADRLKMLESIGVLSKRKLPENKKENVYLLTNKGLDLAPIIMEIVVWSDKHVREYNQNMNAFEGEVVDKELMISNVQKEYLKFFNRLVR